MRLRAGSSGATEPKELEKSKRKPKSRAQSRRREQQAPSKKARKSGSRRAAAVPPPIGDRVEVPELESDRHSSSPGIAAREGNAPISKLQKAPSAAGAAPSADPTVVAAAASRGAEERGVKPAHEGLVLSDGVASRRSGPGREQSTLLPEVVLMRSEAAGSKQQQEEKCSAEAACDRPPFGVLRPKADCAGNQLRPLVYVCYAGKGRTESLRRLLLL